LRDILGWLRKRLVCRLMTDFLRRLLRRILRGLVAALLIHFLRVGFNARFGRLLREVIAKLLSPCVRHGPWDLLRGIYGQDGV
jgi:hypothetical protein